MLTQKLKDKKIEELLKRGVEEVIDKENLIKKIKADKKLRVKFGIDPTKPDIHLGHSVPLLKLRDFQELGHKAILIIGDFTAQIGDPSGQSKEREPLTEKEVKENMKTYLAQASKIIDIKKAEIHFNSSWHKKMKLKNFIELVSLLTVPQILERNDFKERIAEGKSLRIHEFLYPILQAYDSYMVKADLEIGGSDQKFNLLAGRTLMERLNMPPQDILTVPLIEGTDGARKMSKSYGNYIGIQEKPNEMFGKIMSIPDHLIKKYFENLTREPIPNTNNPYKEKLLLAQKIVEMYHGKEKGAKAKEIFIKTFSQKEIAKENLETLFLDKNQIPILELLLKAGIKSKSEGTRLILQGAVKINNNQITNFKEIISLKGGEILKVGKHKFYQIKIKK
jgi:tyrosyl-tRNA synthetase